MIDAEMYGHDAPRGDGEARQRVPGEHVEHAEDAVLLPLEKVRQHVRIDAGHGNMRANAKDHQRAEQEEQAPLEVAVLAAFREILQSP